MLRQLFQYWKLKRIARQLDRAKERAEKQYKLTRQHQLVLTDGRRIRVYSRRMCKDLLKRRAFGTIRTMQELEKRALYLTYKEAEYLTPGV